VALPAFLQPADVANKNAAAKIPGIQYKMLSFQLHTTLPIYKNVPKQTLPQCGNTHHNEDGDPT
jgi:hypothetical protein